MKPRKVLIITSSGGGGLLQAAYAKEQEVLAQDPTASIVRKDVLKDWTWKTIGRWATRKYDEAQRKGDVSTIERLTSKQGLGDFLFWPRIFFSVLYTAFKEDVDHIIDTQPVGTSAILKALRIFNRHRKKNVQLEKIVVDLPTPLATHYFTPVKRLSKADKKFFRMTTIKPLVMQGETVEQFWRSNCNLTEKEIKYDYFSVRQSFKRLQEKKRSNESFTFSARFHSSEEKKLFAKTVERGPLQVQMGEETVQFQIGPQDKVIAIMLGSQPAYEATLGYVRRLMRLAKEPGIDSTAVHLFVFCAEHRVGEDSLLRRVADLVGRAKEYPEPLTVAPLAFQNDEMVAPLFHRCDVTCTRSGGQTAMELMCVMKGEIWVHSEAKKADASDLTTEELLKGIPGWEAGNALYLQKERGAKIVTPETFVPHARRLLMK